MTEAEKLIADCNEAARFYEDKPGLAQQAAVIVDLYRAIARLAALLPKSE